MKKKLCHTCRIRKKISEFNKNRWKADGYSSICRICSNARSKKYYAENREEHKRVISVRKKRVIEQNRALCLEYLLSNPCRDCGETDLVVLEFDHLRDKDRGVKDLVFRACASARVEEEIGKCQVLCANCHRRKTAKERNWFKLGILPV